MKRMQADFFEVQLPRNVDLVITSPPLKLLAKEPLWDIIGKLSAVLMPDGWIVLDMPAGKTPQLVDLVYACRAFDMQFKFVVLQEDMYVAGETQAVYYITWQHIWKPWQAVRREKMERAHPMSHRCEFCPDWVASVILAHSEVGDTVLDPFCGTGTVPRVAEELGREGYGIDIRASAESG